MNPTTSASIASPDKRLVARSFGSAAPSYDAVANLQRSVGMNLLESLPVTGVNGCVLDVGAGTGYFSRILSERYSDAHIIAVDIAEGMLRHARNQFSGDCVGGDAEALPLATGSVELIYSNLAIQWCAHPLTIFREFQRVLKPGGALFFSTFGPRTLVELRRAWGRVDAKSHVIEFVEAEAIECSLNEAGFTDIEIGVSVRELEYADVMSLMRELKGLGARNLTQARPRHLTSKGAMAKMMAAYPCRNSGNSASVSASFEVIVGSAKLPWAACI